MKMNCHIIHTKTLPVPVKIFVESRNNSRVSLASEHIIIRLPDHISGSEKNKRVKEHIEWALKQLRLADHYKHKSRTPAYYQGRDISILGEKFKIELYAIEAGRNKLGYRGDHILSVFLRKDLGEEHQASEIRRLLIKFAERYSIEWITKRTNHFNSIHFKETIGKVRLNHTDSKWGSCSAKRSIMFSTKLLLLPLEVIDYVIIHELAHLKELNHSEKFWKLVEQAMPAYDKWDKWLTKNGFNYNF